MSSDSYAGIRQQLADMLSSPLNPAKTSVKRPEVLADEVMSILSGLDLIPRQDAIKAMDHASYGLALEEIANLPNPFKEGE